MMNYVASWIFINFLRQVQWKQYLNCVNIKDEYQKVLEKEEEIIERLKSYSEKLFNRSHAKN